MAVRNWRYVPQVRRFLRKLLSLDSSFFTYHVLYFILVPVLAAIPMWRLDPILNYSDALFLCVSAMTCTGLSPVNTEDVQLSTEIIIYIMLSVGNCVLISAVPPLLRFITYSRISHKQNADIEPSFIRAATCMLAVAAPQRKRPTLKSNNRDAVLAYANTKEGATLFACIREAPGPDADVPLNSCTEYENSSPAAAAARHRSQSEGGHGHHGRPPVAPPPPAAESRRRASSASGVRLPSAWASAAKGAAPAAVTSAPGVDSGSASLGVCGSAMSSSAPLTASLVSPASTSAGDASAAILAAPRAATEGAGSSDPSARAIAIAPPPASARSAMLESSWGGGALAHSSTPSTVTAVSPPLPSTVARVALTLPTANDATPTDSTTTADTTAAATAAAPSAGAPAPPPPGARTRAVAFADTVPAVHGRIQRADGDGDGRPVAPGAPPHAGWRGGAAAGRGRSSLDGDGGSDNGIHTGAVTVQFDAATPSAPDPRTVDPADPLTGDGLGVASPAVSAVTSPPASVGRMPDPLAALQSPSAPTASPQPPPSPLGSAFAAAGARDGSLAPGATGATPPSAVALAFAAAPVAPSSASASAASGSPSSPPSASSLPSFSRPPPADQLRDSVPYGLPHILVAPPPPRDAVMPTGAPPQREHDGNGDDFAATAAPPRSAPTPPPPSPPQSFRASRGGTPTREAPVGIANSLPPRPERLSRPPRARAPARAAATTTPPRLASTPPPHGSPAARGVGGPRLPPPRLGHTESVAFAQPYRRQVAHTSLTGSAPGATSASVLGSAAGTAGGGSLGSAAIGGSFDGAALRGRGMGSSFSVPPPHAHRGIVGSGELSSSLTLRGHVTTAGWGGGGSRRTASADGSDSGGGGNASVTFVDAAGALTIPGSAGASPSPAAAAATAGFGASPRLGSSMSQHGGAVGTPQSSLRPPRRASFAVDGSGQPILRPALPRASSATTAAATGQGLSDVASAWSTAATAATASPRDGSVRVSSLGAVMDGSWSGSGGPRGSGSLRGIVSRRRAAGGGSGSGNDGGGRDSGSMCGHGMPGSVCVIDDIVRGTSSFEAAAAAPRAPARLGGGSMRAASPATMRSRARAMSVDVRRMTSFDARARAFGSANTRGVRGASFDFHPKGPSAKGRAVGLSFDTRGITGGRTGTSHTSAWMSPAEAAEAAEPAADKAAADKAAAAAAEAQKALIARRRRIRAQTIGIEGDIRKLARSAKTRIANWHSFTAESQGGSFQVPTSAAAAVARGGRSMRAPPPASPHARGRRAPIGGDSALVCGGDDVPPAASPKASKATMMMRSFAFHAGAQQARPSGPQAGANTSTGRAPSADASSPRQLATFVGGVDSLAAAGGGGDANRHTRTRLPPPLSQTFLAGGYGTGSFRPGGIHVRSGVLNAKSSTDAAYHAGAFGGAKGILEDDTTRDSDDSDVSVSGSVHAANALATHGLESREVWAYMRFVSGMLVAVVLTYMVMMQLIFSVAMYVYITMTSRGAVFKDYIEITLNRNVIWWVMFHTGASLNNAGFSLANATLQYLAHEPVVLSMLAILIAAGNTLYPVFLFVFVRALTKAPSQRVRGAARVLVAFPRVFFTHLFSPRETLSLFFMWCILTSIPVWVLAFDLYQQYPNNPFFAEEPISSTPLAPPLAAPAPVLVTPIPPGRKRFATMADESVWMSARARVAGLLAVPTLSSSGFDVAADAGTPWAPTMAAATAPQVVAAVPLLVDDPGQSAFDTVTATAVAQSRTAPPPLAPSGRADDHPTATPTAKAPPMADLGALIAPTQTATASRPVPSKRKPGPLGIKLSGSLVKMAVLVIFSTINVRSAGFNVFDFSHMRTAINMIYVVTMYLGAYPLILTQRARYKKVSSSAKRLLMTDISWFYLALVIIAYLEEDRSGGSSPIDVSLRVIFELSSAIGCVGLSMGWPNASGSAVSGWSYWSRYIVMGIMLMGRSRGVPLSIDLATSLKPAMVDSGTVSSIPQAPGDSTHYPHSYSTPRAQHGRFAGSDESSGDDEGASQGSGTFSARSRSSSRGSTWGPSIDRDRSV